MAAACREGALSSGEGTLIVEPEALELPAAWVGTGSVGTLSVRSTARAGLELSAAVDAPFSAPASTAVGGGETLALAVRFDPAAEGPASGVLHLSWGDQRLDVALSALGRQPPACRPSSECVAAAFDPLAGACVEVPANDGRACPGDRCVVDGRCRAGRCEGGALDCDDANACTTDGCAPEAGCVHADATASCPGSVDPCRVPVCDRRSGCALTDAVDGAPCGPNDCRTAHVCILGRCEVRAAPSGSTCAEATTCRAAGVCQGTSCVLPRPGAPPTRWRYVPAPPRDLRFAGVMDPDGNSYFVESDDVVTEVVSLDREGGERFRAALQFPCTASCAWRVGLVLDPDARRLFLSFPGGRAQARAAADGRLLWDRSLVAGIAPGNPGPDGGAYWANPRAMPAAGGQVEYTVMEGWEDHHSYVFGVDALTGAERWRVYRKGHLYGPGLNGADELWMSSANCWAPAGQTERFSGAGGLLAGRNIAGWPVAVASGRALFIHGYGHRLVDSALRERYLSPGELSLGSYSVLMTASRVIAPATGGGGAHVAMFEVDGGAVVAAPALGNIGSLDLMLGRSGEVIGSGNTQDAGVLFALSPSGAELLRCELPGFPLSAVAVAKERYVAQLGKELWGFELPGFDAAWTGWATKDGTLGRDRRAR